MVSNNTQIDTLKRIIEIQAELVQTEFGLDAFMHRVVAVLQALTRASGAVVELISAEHMVYRSACGIVAPFIGLKLAREGSLSGLCVRDRQVMFCEETHDDPRVDLVACQRLGVRSMICAPLFQGAVPVGVLKVVSEQPGWFDEGDVQVLQMLSGLLGAALAKQLSFEALQHSEERLRILLEHANEAVVRIDSDTVVLSWNRAAENLLGVVATQTIGLHLCDVDRRLDLFPGLGAMFALTPGGAYASNSKTWQDLTLTDHKGNELVVEFNVVETRLGDHRESTVFLHDITERKRVEALTRELAQTDALTGLANRRFFMDNLEFAIKRMTRQNSGLALFYMDLNGFKRLNDEHGHEYGDCALKAFAQRLRACVRAADLAARLGGDEFVLLADGIAQGEQARVLAEKVMASMNQRSPEFDGELSISIGVALYQQGTDVQQWINQADGAMYGAKRLSGTGSRMAIYEPSNSHAQTESVIEQSGSLYQTMRGASA